METELKFKWSLVWSGNKEYTFGGSKGQLLDMFGNKEGFHSSRKLQNMI